MGSGGCGTSSGYRQYLLADDDNGNLNDGTPHMTAIYNAFNDQEIACQTPIVKDFGCMGTPNQQPLVTAIPGNMEVTLTWNSITGASNYEVFRTEGLKKCGQGKVKLTITTLLSFTDSGLMNGREYYYLVIPKGPNVACFGVFYESCLVLYILIQLKILVTYAFIAYLTRSGRSSQCITVIPSKNG